MVDEVALDMSTVKPFEAMDASIPYRVRLSDGKIEKASTGADVFNAVFDVVSPEEVQGIGVLVDKKGNPVLTDEGHVQVGDPMVDEAGNAVMVQAAKRKLFRIFTLTEKAYPFLHEMVRALDPNQVLDENFVFKPKEYIGLEAMARIKNEGYEEQIRARITRLTAVAA
ncbi:hypothetical protein LCGC14_1375840 [marine sediment metagenome]|uniref:Uncharacterized protein n=1 Tax=marine sediment metagenome TaxID=412755 RepID=A0A0F9MJD7_9ZZZZ